jgi:ADP-heptose:LPS heptosyltransferase
VPRRPVTRLPYPVGSELRFWIVGAIFRIFGWLIAPAFRRSIDLGDLRSARILILKPCCLGDVVFATPLARELKRRLPGSTLDFAVGQHSRAALANNPHVSGLVDTGRVGSGPASFHDVLALVRRIRRGRYDACFVLERSALLSLLPLLAGVPIRIGVDSGGRGLTLNVGVSVLPIRPESELYLDLFRAVGGRPADRRLEYHPSAAAVEAADQLARTRLPPGRSFVLLHVAGGVNPGMALLRKRWPTNRFAELARRIAGAGGVPVLVGAAADRAALTDELRGVPGMVDLVGALELDELAALAQRAAAYVGNDSGPTHLAEAAGARTVLLFGPSDHIVYGPRGPNAVAVTSGFWCSPCFENGRVAPCANVLCLPSIPVERVWREIREFLPATAAAE